MLILKAVSLKPLHGYGVLQRIRQISQGALDLNPGTLYPALLRLEQRGWVETTWTTTENNRRAKFYQLTRAGRRQIKTERASWERTVSLMERFLEADE